MKNIKDTDQSENPFMENMPWMNNVLTLRRNNQTISYSVTDVMITAGKIVYELSVEEILND